MKKLNQIPMVGKLVKLGLASIITAGTLFAGTYNVDSTHSDVSFKVKHLMISNVKGQFNSFNGSFEYDEKNRRLKTFSGNIDVNSINTQNKKRDSHLKEEEIFNVKNYPTINFKLNKISKDKAYGVLTMRGITKPIILDFENNGMVKDPWGNTRVGLAFSGKLNRKDYGISWNKTLETGGVVVGEMVKLEVEVEGILAK